jgi:hypothetical protein
MPNEAGQGWPPNGRGRMGRPIPDSTGRGRFDGAESDLRLRTPRTGQRQPILRLRTPRIGWRWPILR